MAAPKTKSQAARPPKPAGARILVVEARFYDDIADALLAGAAKALDEAKAACDIVTVPGSLEIAPAIAIAIDAAEKQKKPYDGAVALGCVIQGETFHFDIVSMQSARALIDYLGRAPAADRQRHPHRRHRGAGLGAGAPDRAGQGRRCRARGARADRAQAPARANGSADGQGGRIRRTDAAPTAAAPRGSPPCRRSTRWISRRPR